jgi:DNA-binding beta-propeller fold protein YncE
MNQQIISSQMKFCRTALAVLLGSIIFPTFIFADILVVAFMEESVAGIVDSATNRTLVRFATGRNPHEVRVSSDGRMAFVVAGRHITAIDLKNRRVRKTYDLGDYSAHDMRISKDGRILWAACAPSKAVVEVNAESGRIVKVYNTDQEGSWFVEISPDERTLYTPNLEGKTVSTIDRATGVVKVIALDSPGYGIDISPDGKFIWVSGGDLAVIDTSTGQIIKRIKASEPQTGRIRITADGKRVVVALARRLAVYDALSYKLLSETALDKEPKVLTLSRDGRIAFLTNPDDNSMSEVDIHAGKVIATTPTGKRPDGIAWVERSSAR